MSFLWRYIAAEGYVKHKPGLKDRMDFAARRRVQSAHEYEQIEAEQDRTGLYALLAKLGKDELNAVKPQLLDIVDYDGRWPSVAHHCRSHDKEYYIGFQVQPLFTDGNYKVTSELFISSERVACDSGLQWLLSCIQVDSVLMLWSQYELGVTKHLLLAGVRETGGFPTLEGCMAAHLSIPSPWLDGKYHGINITGLCQFYNLHERYPTRYVKFYACDGGVAGVLNLDYRDSQIRHRAVRGSESWNMLMGI